MNQITNALYTQVTKGDTRSFIVEYVDFSGAPIDLTGWTFSATFKDKYDAELPGFELSWGDEIEFVGDAPASGQVRFTISDIHTSLVPINLYTACDDDVPYNMYVGDIKAVAPIGSSLELVGNRPIVFLKILARITQ